MQKIDLAEIGGAGHLIYWTNNKNKREENKNFGIKAVDCFWRFLQQQQTVRVHNTNEKEKSKKTATAIFGQI